MSLFPDRADDDRIRYGMEPATPEEEIYWRDLEPGADEYHGHACGSLGLPCCAETRAVNRDRVVRILRGEAA